MKRKTIAVNGATYAEIADGTPTFVGDDGKDIRFDAVHRVGTISRLNGETIEPPSQPSEGGAV